METVRVLGASLCGAAAELVTVEAHFEGRDRGTTEVVLVGLPDPVLRESRGRLLCALRANGLGLGPGRLFLNLVPAARPKSGVVLDLALLLAAAAAGGHLAPDALSRVLCLGEVGIDGDLHAVRGGLAAALAARGAGVTRAFAPPGTADECAALPELDVRAAGHVAGVLAHLAGGEPLARVGPPPLAADPSGGAALLDEVRGQDCAKHALAVAAAGGHGLLFIGPPGAGKSMLARRLVHLLPPPALEERLEITAVLSATDRWPGGLASRRPFRAPHHTTSYAGLVGGGAELVPGEITLAHRGVLFLDELPEFRREALEALREPLENGSALIARAGRRMELPARFQLVCAMNPCPCGYRGHPRVPCTCAPSHVRRYTRRISGPLLDRVELRVELQPAALEELVPEIVRPAAGALPKCVGGEELRERVLVAVRARAARGQDAANANLGTDELERVAPLDADARALLTRAAARRVLSARALQSLRRVARTLADLAGDDRVEAHHLAEALALRAPL